MKKDSKDDYGKYASIGFELVGIVGIAGVAGYYIDIYCKSEPTALIICLVLGLILGMYNLIRKFL